MEPSPREEGFGRRVGSIDIRNSLLIPKDPRGIVLACGFFGLAALGADMVLAAGDGIGLAFTLAAVAGYLFVRTRFVPLVVWSVVAAYGLFTAVSGNASDWLIVGMAGVLAVVALFPPVDWTHEATSRNPELGSDLALSGEAATDETSRNLEVAGASPNGSRSPAHAGLPLAVDLASFGAARRFGLRTIGTLQLEVDGRDQTQRIREQPRLEFLLSYLIARSLSNPGGPVERSAIAAEIAPNLDSSTQLNRLRKTLHALKAALGPELKGLIQTTSSHVRLDITGVDADFVAISDLAARVDRRRGLIDATVADQIRRLLETSAGGEFLAGFSELEHEVTEGRGDAARVVEGARSKIDGWRADLVVALARHFEAASRPQASIAYLQSVINQSPEREDVARLLVAAYMQTGQIARAEEVRGAYKFSLGEV